MFIPDHSEHAKIALIIYALAMYVFILFESFFYYNQKIQRIKPLRECLDLTKVRNAQPEIFWKVLDGAGSWESMVSI